MADVDQSIQENGNYVSLRVNGEIFQSILQIDTVNIKNVVCVGHIMSMDENNVEIQVDETFTKVYKKGSKFNIQNPQVNNYYQFSINVKDDTIEFVHDFGSPDEFDYYSYQTSFFNYWYILKDRYPQLKGEVPMDQ